MLEPLEYEAGISVKSCPSCGGIWLDKNELQAIQESDEHDYSEELSRIPFLASNAYEMARQKLQPDIQCPACGVGMESREYARCSQVMIDVCPSCHGIWLDKGELEALEIFFERSRIKTRDIREAFFAGLRWPHID